MDELGSSEEALAEADTVSQRDIGSVANFDKSVSAFRLKTYQSPMHRTMASTGAIGKATNASSANFTSQHSQSSNIRDEDGKSPVLAGHSIQKRRPSQSLSAAGMGINGAGVQRPSTPDMAEDVNPASCLDREVRRLQVLKTYLGIMDCDHGNKFERLTALASRIFQAPMATITIADLNKQYQLSRRGVDPSPNAAQDSSSFCNYLVMADTDLLVVNDASTDPRFAKTPEVVGSPYIRFYAGAPLICPDGYCLGTLSVMDSKPRENPVTLEEKQSLMELAAMAMETLDALRSKKHDALVDPSQQIACAAHDLLTPLTGIALSLSLLKEDEGLKACLSEQQRDMIETAANCSTFMNSICHKTMDFFRVQSRSSDAMLSINGSSLPDDMGATEKGPPVVKVADLIKNLNMVMEPFPKLVPIIFSVDSNVPPIFVGDDMKIFRSACNYLTNACSKTDSGSIRLRIFKQKNPESGDDEIAFECEDTGPGVDVSKYSCLFKPVFVDSLPQVEAETKNPSAVKDATAQSTGLGLYSVATQIESMGGKYGYRPRQISSVGDSNVKGSIFWFSVPLVLPSEVPPPLIQHQDSNLSNDTPSRKPSMSEDVNRKLRGLLGKDVPSFVRIKRSDSSLNKLSSEEALVAFAAKRVPSDRSMRNETFRLQDAPPRVPQALVIEDSVVVRKNLARVLSKLGFEVTQAVNGMAGLKELKGSLFDLVLCDYLMPVMDGLDCVEQYRQWESINRPFFKQYIIGISAHANDKDIKQGFKVGMNGFRSKPLTFKDVEELKSSRAFKRARSELDKLGQEMEVLKRRKLEHIPRVESKTSLSGISNSSKVCLVIEGSPSISKLAEIASSKIGWKVISVTDTDGAVRLLKMRNWDAVLVDADFPHFSNSISIFREWEQRHRVNRQNNVILLSSSFVSPGGNDTFQVPTGFDGALAKPIDLDALQLFFRDSKSSWGIVSR